jgi:hypothetical protein
MAALGQTVQLTATALDANGQAVSGAVIRWTSSNPAALEVSATGLVTARANGAGTISAITAGAASSEVGDTSAARVEQVPVSMSISPESWPKAQVWIGARRQFTADVRDANGHAVLGAEVEWSVNASRIVVDETGLATAMSSGAATIQATAGGLSDSVPVTVDPEGSSGPGYMYTVWLARTDDAPALIVDGKLRVPELPNTHGDVAAVGGEFVAPWPHNTVEKFQYEGNRIGLLTDMANGVGTFRVLDRAREWSRLGIANVRDFQLENNRIAVILGDGRFRVKDGTQGVWWDLATGAKAFQLENNRIAVQLEDGRLRVKDGLSGTWALIDSTGPAAFQLEGNRIGVLRSNGEFRVKDGLNGAVTTLATSGARQFQLEGNRIALLTDNGEFRVKEGINGAWTLLANQPIRQFELNDNRIGILFESGEFRVKDGIHGAWTVLASQGVQSFQLQAHLIGMLTNEGILRIKNVSNGKTSDTTAYGAGVVTQYRLIIDNPLPPHRTTPASYNAGQSRCRAMTGDPNCYHVTGFALPAPYYGIFCGLNRPTGDDFWGTVGGKAPIDGLDQMCLHHDLKGYWYAGHEDTEGEWDATCIVRFGLEYGRLTRDGSLIAHGDSSWDEWDTAWAGAGMRNLWDGLNNYWTATDVCTDSMLANFDAATGAKH